jgi:hypothetical protein
MSWVQVSYPNGEQAVNHARGDGEANDLFASMKNSANAHRHLDTCIRDSTLPDLKQWSSRSNRYSLSKTVIHGGKRQPVNDGPILPWQHILNPYAVQLSHVSSLPNR